MVSRDKGTITIHSLTSPASASVIFSHGLGDTAEGWEDAARKWAEHLPHVRFVLPTAPVQPVTWNGGMRMPSWYDIVGLSEKESEECNGIEDSVKNLQKLVDSEAAQVGGINRVVVGGFSQGGALSIFTGLGSIKEKLAGVVVLSGYMPCSNKFMLTDSGRDTPVLHCHGDRDPLIKMSVAEKTKTCVLSQGHKGGYEFKIYLGMAHSANNEEMNDVISFLNNVIPSLHEVVDKNPKDMSVKELKAALGKKGIDSSKFVEKYEMIAALEAQQ